MGDNSTRRDRWAADQIVPPVSQGDESVLPPAMPPRLRRGIREALDGGHGRLRMDPQDLANLIGSAIDQEIDRLSRERIECERQRKMKQALLQPALFFGAHGARGNLTQPEEE